MKFFHWLDENLEETLLVLFLSCMTLVMGVQVFCRYLLNFSLSWSEEITRYLFNWSAFISISYCIKKWISIKIDQIIKLFPKNIYVVFQLLLNLILFLLFITLSYYAVFYLLDSIESGQVSPACHLPMYFVQSAPLAGFVLASIRAFQQILLDVSNILHIFTQRRKEKVK
ncbi:TRAP transporter small permease [Amedibacterium intestinale]|uniref:TRAP transporter small permease n=1 Tax=Amedibacterium intestinale TaxID=2583452 RepID=UPI000E1FEFBA